MVYYFREVCVVTGSFVLGVTAVAGTLCPRARSIPPHWPTFRCSAPSRTGDVRITPLHMRGRVEFSCVRVCVYVHILFLFTPSYKVCGIVTGELRSTACLPAASGRHCSRWRLRSCTASSDLEAVSCKASAAQFSACAFPDVPAGP